ncbi:SusE domain-containing protein [Flammeovirga sp. OC4]|uniref:SusE domain-containing protein n=1 Tax=Flammeovirga sp. OC4 TaxID=1382345 RepID=UPI0005C457AA|nr:SusE domain-containing protein [Flammeovirga sp. OC4]
MKKIYKGILLIGLFAAIYACSEDSTEPRISGSENNVSAEILSPTTGTTIALDTANGGADSVAATFEWSPAKYNGLNLARNYEILLSDTEDFANTQSLGTTGDTQLGVLTKDINNAAVALGLAVDTEHTIYSRISTTVTANIDTLISEGINFKMTPYLSVINYPRVYVPGDFNNWTNNSDTYSLASVNFDNTYEGYMPLQTDADGNPVTGNFKILTESGNWDSQYGLPNGSALPTNNPVAIIPKKGNGPNDDDPDACRVPSSVGDQVQYRLIAKLGETDGSYTAEASIWRIVGDATPNGWPGDAPNDKNDTDMVYDRATNTWSVDVTLTTGNLKFRANHSWDLNLGTGDQGPNSLKYGGGDIPISTAGEYTVKLDLSDAPNWKYELIQK